MCDYHTEKTAETCRSARGHHLYTFSFLPLLLHELCYFMLCTLLLCRSTALFGVLLIWSHCAGNHCVWLKTANTIRQVGAERLEKAVAAATKKLKAEKTKLEKSFCERGARWLSRGKMGAGNLPCAGRYWNHGVEKAEKVLAKTKAALEEESGRGEKDVAATSTTRKLLLTVMIFGLLKTTGLQAWQRLALTNVTNKVRNKIRQTPSCFFSTFRNKMMRSIKDLHGPAAMVNSVKNYGRVLAKKSAQLRASQKQKAFILALILCLRSRSQWKKFVARVGNTLTAARARVVPAPTTGEQAGEQQEPSALLYDQVMIPIYDSNVLFPAPSWDAIVSLVHFTELRTKAAKLANLPRLKKLKKRLNRASSDLRDGFTTFKQNLRQTFRSLLAICPAEARPALLALFLLRILIASGESRLNLFIGDTNNKMVDIFFAISASGLRLREEREEREKFNPIQSIPTFPLPS